jgi:DNA invertase Pin-like site-specific DNA recombinase
VTDYSAEIDPARRRRAYSYSRFSTAEQSKGDSFNRQIKMAQAYARKHNLDLDETLTFHDKGVSGYRGQNVSGGRLADFREAVQVGLVPQGSVLLVEQLDRISRLSPRKALRVLEDIVEAGVSVVTLNDGREYTPEGLDHDHTDLLISLLTFMRANEESETKSRRLRHAWNTKLLNIKDKPRTSIAPAWLRFDREAGRFQPIPERAALVQRIFAMTLEGVGQHKIAETFNRQGIAPWGRAQHWQRSYIAKILRNPAVIGTVVPHRIEHAGGKKLRVPLEPVQGYFPAVVSAETYAEVQALQAARTAPTRGRHAQVPVTNLLAGLAACPKCGRTMTRVQKGRKSLPAFVCTAAKAGAGCEYRSVRYEYVERRLLQVLPHVIADREGIEVAEELEDKIASLDAGIEAQRDTIEYLTDQLLEQRSPALAARLRQLEADLPILEAELADLRERRDIAAGPVVGSRIARAIEALQPSEAGELDRAAANRALRAIFRRAVINWPRGSVDLEWTTGGACSVQYGWREDLEPAMLEPTPK